MKNENLEPTRLNEEQLEATVGGRSEVEMQIRTLFAEKRNIPVESVLMNSRIIDDLGADSLDVADIVKSAENHFSVNAVQTNLVGVRTVSDLVELFAKKRP